MIERDQAEINAEALLPCAWKNINDAICDLHHKCGACQNRPAVAEALRKRDKQVDYLNKTVEILSQSEQKLESRLTTADKEIERLKADANEISFALTSSGLTAIIRERDQFRAELVMLKEERKGIADAALSALKRGW